MSTDIEARLRKPSQMGEPWDHQIMVEAADTIAALKAQLTEAREARHGIYVASRVSRAPIWLRARADGQPIISTWIDEAGEGQRP